MVNSEIDESLVDRQIGKKSAENSENKITFGKYVENGDEKLKKSSKVSSDGGDEAADLKHKLKRKKLASKQQSDSGINGSKKKKQANFEPKIPTLILGRLDSVDRFVKHNSAEYFIADGPSSAASYASDNEDLKRRDVGTWVRSVAGATDSDFLGCCEPGTSVTLEGIVWQETPAGVLVVNVTWRGKSYVGTLLDCTKSDWSAPRFSESPNAADTAADWSKNNVRGRNLKRNATSSSTLNKSGSSGANENSSSKSGSATNPVKATTAGGPSGAPAASDAPPEPSTSALLSTASGLQQVSNIVLEPSSPVLFECPLDGCEKKFAQIVALRYHQNSTHEFRARVRQDIATSTDPTFLQYTRRELQ